MQSLQLKQVKSTWDPARDNWCAARRDCELRTNFSLGLWLGLWLGLGLGLGKGIIGVQLEESVSYVHTNYPLLDLHGAAVLCEPNMTFNISMQIDYM